LLSSEQVGSHDAAPETFFGAVSCFRESNHFGKPQKARGKDFEVVKMEGLKTG
jgi:hypothetical protein